MVIAILFSFPSLATIFEQDKKVIIAHAGGGGAYLNTLEATLHSIKKGFQYIELDLLETNDGDLVAAHDWQTFHRLTGYPDQVLPLFSHQCKKRKILKKQTVLTSDIINTIFEQNNGIYLVTDKIRNIDLIKQKFSKFLDRIIIEVKYPNECTEAKKKGIKYCAFLFDEKLLIEEHMPLLVTIPFLTLEKHKKWFLKHPNVQALVYTVNDIEIAKKILNYPFVKGIYTDILPPIIIKEEK